MPARRVCPRRSHALDLGASVTLLDAADQLGGQYWRHAPATAGEPTDAQLQHGWNTFGRLRDAIEADPRCRVLTSAHVWAIEHGSGADRARAPRTGRRLASGSSDLPAGRAGAGHRRS